MNTTMTAKSNTAKASANADVNRQKLSTVAFLRKHKAAAYATTGMPK